MSKQKQQADAAQPQEQQEQQANAQPPAGEKKAGGKSGQKKAVPALALQVRGPARGRWRAGRRFGPEPVVIPLAELTDEARAAIEADPLLSVREVRIET